MEPQSGFGKINEQGSGVVPPKPVDWTKVRTAILKKRPNLTKTQIAKLDTALQERAQKQLVLANAAPFEDLATKNPMAASSLLAQGFDPTQNPELTADQKKKQSAYKASVNFLDELEKQFKDAGGGEYKGFGAILSGTGKNIGGKIGLNPNARIYNRIRSGFTSSLKELTGDVGVLTEQDYERIANLLPKLTDDPQTAEELFNTLRSQLSAKFGGEKTTTSYTRPQDKGGGLSYLAGDDSLTGNLLVQPFVRTGKNIESAAVTVPQLLAAKAQSDPQKAAQIASPDIKGIFNPEGTQKRAGEIAAKPVESVVTQLFDSASIYGAGKLAQKARGVKLKKPLTGVDKAAERRVMAAAEADAAGKSIAPQQLANTMAAKIKASTDMSEPMKQKLLQRVQELPKGMKDNISIQQSLGDFMKADAYTQGGKILKGTEGRYAFYLRESYKDLWKDSAPDVLKGTAELSKALGRRKTISKLKNPAVGAGIGFGTTAALGAMIYPFLPKR